jgi:CRISPR-associated protein Csd1
MLGYRIDDPKPKRTLQTFEAFRDKHLELEAEINDEHFSAACKFLKTWKPETAPAEKLDEIGTGFGVFRIEGETEYVHQRDKIDRWWKSQLAETASSDDVEMAQCLITGEQAPIARLHEPKIKGVAGAQSSGASIVSFNFDAGESYGKSQSFNSPVSEASAFYYGTALNFLLNSNQRLRIGDATTVFWTEKPSPIESIFGQVFDTAGVDDETTKSNVMAILTAISQGKFPDELGNANAKFFVLGLSPNAARISVRFWYQSTVGELVANIKQHFQDLEMAHGENDNPFPSAWLLLSQTARESKDVPPRLSGALLRSILQGHPYPHALFAAVLRRIRADQRIVYLRAAIIKAYLNRLTRNQNLLTGELSMELDKERPEPAYHMGRLFAELEKTQEDALKGINDTIKDRYFGAASATPSSVFPRIIRLSQHHLGKLPKGSRVYHERRIQEICSRIETFPPNLNLHQQGLFALGYYHQRHDIFTKKDEPVEEPVAAE